ncbi:HVO_A0114 family putative DNA-binding protein [Salinarimonas sp. NSM]|uniref:HVO_A0114 family putative DNA-binding protein n=1 Tax=Salinarimonas sp. NSM TaxID=3458003 RepID=UPI004036AC21
MLARMRAVATSAPEDAFKVLASAGNRDLLGLIGREAPQSISALSELAGRAQPNVSRSLSALVGAGLVLLRQDGRSSIPELTDLGREKAAELGLLDLPTRATRPADESVAEPSFLTVRFDGSPDDGARGAVLAHLPRRDGQGLATVSLETDIEAWAGGLVDHWWRMLYRRDAPHPLGTFAAASGPVPIAVKSHGPRIERIVRGPITMARDAAFLPLEELERDLIAQVLEPVAARLRAGRRFDRPMQAKLARLLETRAFPAEHAFARTAGALGISPYDLGDARADALRELIADMPDEDVRLDFASAVLDEELGAASEWISAELRDHGSVNTMRRLPELAGALSAVRLPASARPWERGTSMAKALRRTLKLGPDASLIDLEHLAERFGSDYFAASSLDAPAALRGYQGVSDAGPIVVVEDEGPERTAFTLARAIGDYLVFESRASCVADRYTDRQAVGRAFAAEFMAPAEGVVQMVEDGMPMERVARHYGTTLAVVSHQYGNNADRLADA